MLAGRLTRSSYNKRKFSTELARLARFTYYPRAYPLYSIINLARDGVRAVSSIRPLITITVLVLVGAFLYMKINETEPVLPEGVESWTVEQDIEIGDGFDFTPDFSTDATTASAAPAGESAPSFSPSPSTEAPAFAPSPSTAATTEAPTFNPSTTNSSTIPSEAPAFAADAAASAPAFNATVEVPVETSQPPVDSATPEVTTSVEVPDLPPLPSMPPSAESAPPVEAQATNPSVPSVLAPGEPAASMTTEAVTEPAPQVANSAAPTTPTSQTQTSLFAATRLAVQSALDRGELSQALLLLSDWYGDPSLSPQESTEVQTLLGQLAGSVIYSTEPRLEPPYLVQAGETLEDIAKKHSVPWQLLAKINGIQNPQQLQAGQQLKVLRGPFSAVIDLSKRQLTLMLSRRYAGKFNIEIDPTISVEEGHWTVNQKLLAPSATGYRAATPTEERSLTLSSENGNTTQLAIIRATGNNGLPAEPASRVIRLKPHDVEDVYDILSVGSRVTIRR